MNPYKIPAFPTFKSRQNSRGARWLGRQAAERTKVQSALGRPNHPFWRRVEELRKRGGDNEI